MATGIVLLGFCVISLLGYAKALSSGNENAVVLVACIGLVLSTGWLFVNFGSKYWQENWESVIENIDKNGEITGRDCGVFAERLEKKIRFSVSKIVISISVFLYSFGLRWL